MQKITIIGAGPAGLLLAHYLLSHDRFQVEMYDRFDDPRSLENVGNRTFPLSLQERGIKALRGIPRLAEKIADRATFCTGTMLYSKSGKPRIVKREKPILCIDRNELVTILLNELTQNYADDRLKITFNCCCTEIDAEAKLVTLETENGERLTTHYELLVGADGARSRVRECLVNSTDLHCEQSYALDDYKSLFLNRINSDESIALAPDKIHASNIGNQIRILLVPQPGDRLNGTIIFKRDKNPFENFSTVAELKAFFQENFPLFSQLMSSEEAESLFERAIGRIVTVKCDRFHYCNSILLIGDAAHAVSPSIGQGCNAALAEAKIIAELSDRYGDNWSQILAEFSRQQVPEARALQELSDYCFPRSKWLILEFFLRLRIRRLLNRWFPQWFKPFLFDLIFDTDCSYSEIVKDYRFWIDRVKRNTESFQ
jgi:kynurenine 3-monooxygenase